MSTQNVFKLTKAKYNELMTELEFLNNTRKKEIEDQLKEARAFGDLSENAEYDEAKNEQGRLYSRIAELDSILSNYIIIDNNLTTSEVSMGCKVIVEDVADKIKEEYHIVGSQEANPLEMKISDESPFGKAMLGKKIGDKISVETPSGASIVYKIIEIKA